MIKLTSPAKINLFLEILSKRDDNFHEISSVMAPINMFDEIIIENSDDYNIKINSVSNRKYENEIILIRQVVRYLETISDNYFPVSIVINKTIPSPSGLGGVSSNIGTILVGINRLWKMNRTMKELQIIAQIFGSDIPFFINPVVSHVTGRGEIVNPLNIKINNHIILLPMEHVKSPEHKTATLYSQVLHSDMSDGSMTNSYIDHIKESSSLEKDSFNGFMKVIQRNYIDQYSYIKHISKFLEINFTLSGSGPAIFAVIDSKDTAQLFKKKLLKKNIESFIFEII
jgi:4-diphosphocytidyl-2-C-methyl-D-erythritol kinase